MGLNTEEFSLQRKKFQMIISVGQTVGDVDKKAEY